MKLLLSLPALSALALLAACDLATTEPDTPATPAAQAPQSAPAELPSVGPKADEMRTANIDWERARADMAEQDGGDEEDGLVTTASSAELAPVPVLLPTGIVTPASATRGVVFRQMSDGYFASYPGEVYDVVINGTNLVAGTDAEAASRPDEPVFTASVAGAQLSLSRYGADYLIEFECNIDLDPEAESCITEGEALDIAEKLIVAGTR